MPKLMEQVVKISPLDTDATVEVLNRILHFELHGVMQHFHHRWMSRWLRASRPRAIAIGQHIAALTGAPSLGVDQLMDGALTSADDMLDAARSHERRPGGRVPQAARAGRRAQRGAGSVCTGQIAAEERHDSPSSRSSKRTVNDA